MTGAAAGDTAGSPPPAATDAAKTAMVAGRGVVWITGSKAYFIVAGFGVQIVLPRLFSDTQFGDYASVMNIASILNNVLIAATVQTVSKLVSEDDARAAARLRQGLKLQALIGVALAGAMFFGAPLLAARFLLDPKLTLLFRIVSVVNLAYALYAALVGSLNGRRLFGRQAALDATFTTIRTAGLIGGAALGVGVVGSISGFAIAATLILLIALAVVGPGSLDRQGDASWKRWLAFMAPLWLYQAFLNGILQADLMLLKRMIAALSIDAGVSRAAAAEIASKYVGYYRAAQTFAFVPYQLILSVTFVVFPLVSKATSGGDIVSTRGYIRSAMRFSLLVLLSIAAPVAGASEGVLRIAYREQYLVGSDALGVLAFGVVAFALFVIAATVLSGAGRPIVSAIIAGIALVAVVAGNIVFVSVVGVGDHTLVAAAAGTTAGTTLALLAVGIAVYASFGAFLPIVPAVRCLLAGGAGFAVARALPHDSALSALLALAAGFTAYVVALAALREIGPSDLAQLRRIAGRK